MASQNNTPKNLIESKLFEASKKKIIPDAKRFDDAINAITFVVAKKPEEFPEIGKTGIRVAKTKRTPDMPSMSIYFKEFEQKIVLLDVKVVPDNNS